LFGFTQFFCVFFLIDFWSILISLLAKKNKMENKFVFFFWILIFFFREELAKVLVDG